MSWGRQVKARHRRRGPVLWLFTDEARLPDPRPAIAALPRVHGPPFFGVVLRHDGAPDRAQLAEAVAALCRQRRVMLSIAGDWRLAARLRAGVHLRGGIGLVPRRSVCTAAAHGRAQLLRARRTGALVFLSPVFPTASHPKMRTLGAVRWALLAGGSPAVVLALGGIDGRSVRRLPLGRIAGAGAIAALGAAGRAS